MHTFRAVADSVKEIHLDIQKINVKGVYDADQGNRSLSYRVDSWDWIADEDNDVLTVYLAKELSIGETCRIKIGILRRGKGRV